MDSSDCDVFSSSPKNNYIDEITMQLLMNKQCKSKLMQNDSDKSHECDEYYSKLSHYKLDIIDLFKNYMNDYDYHVCHELDDAFQIFVKSSLKHFEIKEVEQENNYNNDDEDEVLFQNVNAFTKTNSYWGKGVKKI